MSLKDTYAVSMPPGYFDALDLCFGWFDYQALVRLVIPGGATACLVGGFIERLLLSAGLRPATCRPPPSAFGAERRRAVLYLVPVDGPLTWVTNRPRDLGHAVVVCGPQGKEHAWAVRCLLDPPSRPPPAKDAPCFPVGIVCASSD